MVTTEEFVKALGEVYISKKSDAEVHNLCEFARQRGWLEEQDMLLWNRGIERRQAARIIHEFLRIEFLIPDLRDWSNAKKLKDLYDCRVCAKHVAQVVERGIMPPIEPDRFMLLRQVYEGDLQDILERLNKVITE